MKNRQDIPTIDKSLSALAKLAKVVHESLNREYYERRENLVNAGMSQHSRYILPSIQKEVTEFVVNGPFSPEQKH